MQRVVTLFRTTFQGGQTVIGDQPIGSDYRYAIANDISQTIEDRTYYITQGYSNSKVNTEFFNKIQTSCEQLHEHRNPLAPLEMTHEERLCNEALARMTEEMCDGSLLEQAKDFFVNKIGVGLDWISWGPFELNQAIPQQSLAQNWEATRKDAACARWDELQKAYGCGFN